MLRLLSSVWITVSSSTLLIPPTLTIGMGDLLRCLWYTVTGELYPSSVVILISGIQPR